SFWPFFWLFIAGSMFILQAYLRALITKKLFIVLMRQEEVKLPGKKVYYAVAAGLIHFILLSALYLAVITYVGAPLQSTCWLIIGVPLSLIQILSTSSSLKHFTFEG